MEGVTRTPAGVVRTRVVGRTWLTHRDFELELERPPDFVFRPGQGLRFELGGREREYTIVSAPEHPTIVLCVRRVEGGGVTSWLAQVEPGHVVRASGPHGFFDYTTGTRPSVFVATGIGVTPFVAMVRAGARPAVMLQGARNEDERPYADLLKAHAGFHVPCLTAAGQAIPDADNVYHGRVTAYLRERLERGSYDFYLCGRRGMIAQAIRIVDERYPGSRVRTMAFA